MTGQTWDLGKSPYYKQIKDIIDRDNDEDDLDKTLKNIIVLLVENLDKVVETQVKMDEKLDRILRGEVYHG